MDKTYNELKEEWKEVLEVDALPRIKDDHRAVTTALVLENTRKELKVYKNDRSQFLFESGPTNQMGISSSDASTGAIDTFDPVLISLLRRAVPNLVAYDLCGVQAMTGPSGIIFAMRSRYSSQTGDEAFYFEANTGFAARGGMGASANSLVGYANATIAGGGANNVGSNTSYSVPSVSNNAGNSTYNYAGGVRTNQLEALGTSGCTDLIFPEMAMSIEKVTVEAKGRALKAEYSMEIAQDLKAIHGLDAETELSNILSTEILAEINREIVRTIVVTAVPGAIDDTTTAGVFDLDVDSNGRWLVEKFKGMHFQIEREANKLAKATRRGKGNVMLCTADVASALYVAGILSNTPKLDADLNVDDTGATFAGVINGKMKVYIDPYALGGQYMVVGYKGVNPWDAGIFYCPYVPLQMVRAVDPNTFQPKIGFKTRYGIVANPFAGGINVRSGALTQDDNVYYRRVIVTHLQ